MESGGEGFNNSKKKQYYEKLVVELPMDIMQGIQLPKRYGIVAYDFEGCSKLLLTM